MKKVLLIVSIVILAALGGLPWLLGTQLEKHLPAQIAASAKEAARYGLAIQLRNYQRHYLSSRGEILVVYQPPGQQVPLYQGVAALEVRHAPLLTSGFNLLMARLTSDDDAQGELAQALPAAFLDARAALGIDGTLALDATLQGAQSNLLPHPNHPQHLAFLGAQFRWQSTLTGYPHRGQGHVQLAGLTFTDRDQRWQLEPLRIDFASHDRYEGEGQLPEFILRHSVHAHSAREQLKIAGMRFAMQQGLTGDGRAYPQSLDYHIADALWTHEQQGQSDTQHLTDLNLNVTLRPGDGDTPGAQLRVSGQALQLALPGGWQDIAPDAFRASLTLHPFTPEEAMLLLDRLRHPLPPAAYLPLPEHLAHLAPHPGLSRILHYLAGLMAKDAVRARLQGELERNGAPLFAGELILEEAMDGASGADLLHRLADAVNYPAKLPALLAGSRLHAEATPEFVRKSGLGLALLIAGQAKQWLAGDGSLLLDALISADSITINGEAYENKK
ncbi:MAG: DUF945 family protein [Cardiobacteriaceae bacterium]|nr:DUF945 family protein [Cardiobacteriaceae bacterium]